MQQKSDRAICKIAKVHCKALVLLVCLVLTACGSPHHVRFYLDEYDFVDKTLKANIEAVAREQFKEEPDVPLELYFEEPCGLLVTTLDCFEATQRDSVVASYDIEIETMHYEYYGYRAAVCWRGIYAISSPTGNILKRRERRRKYRFSHAMSIAPVWRRMSI